MARFGSHQGATSPIVHRSLRAIAMGVALLVVAQQTALAQIGGGGNTIGGGATSGVAVDADGVLRRVQANDPTGELA